MLPIPGAPFKVPVVFLSLLLSPLTSYPPTVPLVHYASVTAASVLIIDLVPHLGSLYLLFLWLEFFVFRDPEFPQILT